MTNAEILKNKFSYLETIIKNKYKNLPESGWATFIANNYLPYDLRDDLIAINQIRNILTHNTLDNGDDILEPSNGIIKKLDIIINYFDKPILLIDKAIIKPNLLWASLNDNVLDIMNKMNKLGYSNVPVLDSKGLIKGIFNSDIIFI